MQLRFRNARFSYPIACCVFPEFFHPILVSSHTNISTEIDPDRSGLLTFALLIDWRLLFWWSSKFSNGVLEWDGEISWRKSFDTLTPTISANILIHTFDKISLSSLSVLQVIFVCRLGATDIFPYHLTICFGDIHLVRTQAWGGGGSLKCEKISAGGRGGSQH